MIWLRYIALFLLAMNASSIDALQWGWQHPLFSQVCSYVRGATEPVQRALSNRWFQAGMGIAGVGALAYTIYAMRNRIKTESLYKTLPLILPPIKRKVPSCPEHQEEVYQTYIHPTREEEYFPSQEEIQQMEAPKELMLSYLRSNNVLKEDNIGALDRIADFLDRIVSFLRPQIVSIPQNMSDTTNFITSLIPINGANFAINTFDRQKRTIYRYDLLGEDNPIPLINGIAARYPVNGNLIILKIDQSTYELRSDRSNRPLYTYNPMTQEDPQPSTSTFDSFIQIGSFKDTHNNIFDPDAFSDKEFSEQFSWTLGMHIEPPRIPLPNGSIVAAKDYATIQLYTGSDDISPSKIQFKKPQRINSIAQLHDNRFIVATSEFDKKTNQYSIYLYNGNSVDAFQASHKNQELVMQGNGRIRGVTIFPDQVTLAAIIENAGKACMQLFNMQKKVPIGRFILPLANYISTSRFTWNDPLNIISLNDNSIAYAPGNVPYFLLFRNICTDPASLRKIK